MMKVELFSVVLQLVLFTLLLYTTMQLISQMLLQLVFTQDQQLLLLFVSFTDLYEGINMCAFVVIFYHCNCRFRISMVLVIALSLFRAFHFSCSLDSYKAVKVSWAKYELHKLKLTFPDCSVCFLFCCGVYTVAGNSKQVLRTSKSQFYS